MPQQAMSGSALRPSHHPGQPHPSVRSIDMGDTMETIGIDDGNVITMIGKVQSIW